MSVAGNEARRVLYNGRVQGVGFRYAARRIAQGHAVTGFVRNLDDGRVELEIEGSTAEIELTLAEIAAAMSGYIRDTQIVKKAATGKFSSFEVAY